MTGALDKLEQALDALETAVERLETQAVLGVSDTQLRAEVAKVIDELDQMLGTKSG